MASSPIALMMGAATTSAYAQASTSQQWVTSITPTTTQDIGTGGATQTFTFGTTGVTASYVATLASGANDGVESATNDALDAIWESLGIPASNVDQFLEPTPAAGSASDVFTTYGGQTLTSTFTFNQPVIDPILHFANLNLTTVTVGGTSTTGSPIGITTLSGNNVMTTSGNTIDTTLGGGPNGGCQNNNGTNPAGRCGSFELTAASGEIRAFTLTDVDPDTPDGWAWTISFPTASLTKAFSPSTISPGGTSQLTFSVSNPANPGQPAAMSPLNFTDTFPSGLTLADTTTSNNGDCGTPALTDGAGDSLAVGDTSVQAAAVSVAAGETCTITLDVTAATTGSYTNDDTNLSTTVANVVPDTTATLTVSTTVGTPIANPEIAGLAAGGLLAVGLGALGLRRYRRSAA
jgi:hypothetical protein